MEARDVIIIGAGPTGLAAARRLHDLGIKDVLVIEREAEAGGIPRHCGHTGFGWDSHHRLWTGPRFAAELRNAATQVEIRTRTTVLELGREGRIRVQTAMGVREMQGQQILLATGTRETPRSARLIGGSRPLAGVMNTGALQQHVYLHGNKPFQRPVIIGSEWVSYSALLTCRHHRHQASRHDRGEGADRCAFPRKACRPPGLWRASEDRNPPHRHRGQRQGGSCRD